MMIDETEGAPDTVVTIPLAHPVRGAAVAVELTALTDKRLRVGEFLGTVDAETMDRISAALRVTLDLTQGRLSLVGHRVAPGLRPG
ncbi:hypothetical protein SAZ11_22540 [Streptomyces sp. FXJ1.4098]|uniref:hypothetical protein n=1 Tax=Streptomyces sp. NPDC020845 TaxID=3365096 RepID=UPI0029952925|nr:hypothetical protein [Streptomyces sp. FXJ1.4098]